MNRTWLLLALGCLSFTVTDGVYLVQVANGTWVSGGPWDAGWWAAAPLWALAAWTRRRRPTSRTRGGARRRGHVLPLVFAAVALTVLVAAAIWTVNLLAVALAAAALVASIARLNLTLRAHAASLRHAQGEALTDALTGLGNRRLLAIDLDDRLAVAARAASSCSWSSTSTASSTTTTSSAIPRATPSSPAWARACATAVGSDGRAYRLGGDEFCALLAPGEDDWEALVEACTRALCEEGEGYPIGCSHGAILLPDEAADATDAMRLADQRMYACKQDGRLSAIRQATDALLRAMTERFPDLGDHTAEVADGASRAMPRVRSSRSRSSSAAQATSSTRRSSRVLAHVAAAGRRRERARRVRRRLAAGGGRGGALAPVAVPDDDPFPCTTLAQGVPLSLGGAAVNRERRRLAGTLHGPRSAGLGHDLDAQLGHGEVPRARRGTRRA